MPKSLKKVQEHIARRKGKAAVLHEKSRDSKILQRASVREGRIAKQVSGRSSIVRPFLLRVAFFQDVAVEATEPLSQEAVHKEINRYLRRLDEQLAALGAERRPGRPPHSSVTLLRQRQQEDDREYAAGFWMPDMEDGESIKALREWNGDWVALSILKFVRITEAGGKRESKFPPRGLS